MARTVSLGVPPRDPCVQEGFGAALTNFAGRADGPGVTAERSVSARVLGDRTSTGQLHLPPHCSAPRGSCAGRDHCACASTCHLPVVLRDCSTSSSGGTGRRCAEGEERGPLCGPCRHGARHYRAFRRVAASHSPLLCARWFRPRGGLAVVP